MAGELFKMMAGVNMVHVPYRGQAAALTDLLGGQVLVDFATMPPSIGHRRGHCQRAQGASSDVPILRRCQSCRRLASSCRATTRAPPRDSAHPRTLPLK
jgi:Tripartite tricarboxylate transporter family receptor